MKWGLQNEPDKWIGDLIHEPHVNLGSLCKRAFEAPVKGAIFLQHTVKIRVGDGEAQEDPEDRSCDGWKPLGPGDVRKNIREEASLACQPFPDSLEIGEKAPGGIRRQAAHPFAIAFYKRPKVR